MFNKKPEPWHSTPYPADAHIGSLLLLNNGFNIIIWKNIKGCSFPTINSNDYSSYEVMKLTQYFMGV